MLALHLTFWMSSFSVFLFWHFSWEPKGTPPNAHISQGLHFRGYEAHHQEAASSASSWTLWLLETTSKSTSGEWFANMVGFLIWWVKPQQKPMAWGFPSLKMISTWGCEMGGNPPFKETLSYDMGIEMEKMHGIWKLDGGNSIIFVFSPLGENDLID